MAALRGSVRDNAWLGHDLEHGTEEWSNIPVAIRNAFVVLRDASAAQAESRQRVGLRG